MTLAVPGATGFVALAQGAVIKHVPSCLSTVRRPSCRTPYENAAGQAPCAPEVSRKTRPVKIPARVRRILAVDATREEN